MAVPLVTEDCLKQAVREYMKANDLSSLEELGSNVYENSYFPVTLLDVFQAGLETLGCKTVIERKKAAEKVSCGDS